MFPQKDLSETQETLKSFFRVISEVIFHICIRLIIRRLDIPVFSSLTPKSLFLVFWQIGDEQWAVSDERWAVRKVGTSACSVRSFSLTQIAPIPPKGLDIRTFWAMSNEQWAMSNERWAVSDERKRLEDVNMNSRGLLSPRFLTSAQSWRLWRRESAT